MITKSPTMSDFLRFKIYTSFNKKTKKTVFYYGAYDV